MRTNERRQHLRAALVEAAERVIAERGLPHLKARDLASAVGCAVGAIYNVFPDLDGLILEVNLRTLVLFEAYIAQAHKDGRPGGAGGGSGAEPSAPVRAPSAAMARLVRAPHGGRGGAPRLVPEGAGSLVSLHRRAPRPSLPTAPCARTPSSRSHNLFRHPRDGKPWAGRKAHVFAPTDLAASGRMRGAGDQPWIGGRPLPELAVRRGR
jgi:AcrR family transcriptional regulator